MSIGDRAAGALRKALIAAVGRDAIDAEGYARSDDESMTMLHFRQGRSP